MTICTMPHPFISLSRRARGRAQRAFGMLEAMISSAIVGLLLVAVLNSVGASAMSQQRTAEARRGQLLASALMSEILQQAFTEPTDAPMFGREAGESLRSQLDDVDDYNGYSTSPPVDRGGAAIAGADGWTQSVTVAWAKAGAFDQTGNSSDNVKRITVTLRKGSTIVTLTALRTLGWDKCVKTP